jgi:hypothetical protein
LPIGIGVGGRAAVVVPIFTLAHSGPRAPRDFPSKLGVVARNDLPCWNA